MEKPEKIINNNSFDNNPSAEFDKEQLRESYLNLLPEELAEKLADKTLEEIQEVVRKREALGYKKIIGYHVSDKDIPEGMGLMPQNGVIEYSDNLQNLYGRHGGGFIYVIEGSANDIVTDPDLGWRKMRVKENEPVRIIQKIPITPETMEALGAKFARCEYH